MDKYEHCSTMSSEPSTSSFEAVRRSSHPPVRHVLDSKTSKNTISLFCVPYCLCF